MAHQFSVFTTSFVISYCRRNPPCVRDRIHNMSGWKCKNDLVQSYTFLDLREKMKYKENVGYVPSNSTWR